MSRVYVGFLLACCCLGLSNNGFSAEASAYCPPFYCEDIPLAQELKAQKKQAAEQLGLPKRLSVLFDALGNCRGCIETAPTWPHLVVVYDGEKLSEHHGQKIESYTTSRPWSASGEYKARQDQMAGLAREFHITLGSKPCKCCKAESNEEYREWQLSESYEVLSEDPLWNSELQTYQPQTISVTTAQSAAIIPDDLEDIAPINQRNEPVPGRLQDFMVTSGVRVVQVLCEKCQKLADDYNQVGRKINAQYNGLSSIKRDTAYEQNMIDYSLSQLDALAQVANTSNVRKQKRDHEKSLKRAQSELAKLNEQEANILKKLDALAAELKVIAAKLVNCEQTQCVVEPNEPVIALEPLEVYTLGDFEFLVDTRDAVCPLNTREVQINSNNGNPLEITDVGDKGRADDEMEQEVVGNNTNSPKLRNVVECRKGEAKRFNATVEATVTDTVTGESTDIKISAKGEISKNAKTSSDPNHMGYRLNGDEPARVDWEPVESKCRSCQQLVAQYNDVMNRLFSLRLSRANIDNILKAPEKSFFYWTKDKSRDLDPTTQEGAKALSLFMNLIDKLKEIRKLLDEQILAIEEQANYLQWAISECEREQCGTKDRLKFEEVLIGGENINGHYQPEFSQLFLNYDVDWNGPYTTNCLACADIVKKLNAMPGWLTRAHFKSAKAQGYIDFYHKLESLIGVFARPEVLAKSEQELAEAKIEIEQLALYNKQLIGELKLCEAKFCPAQADDSPGASLPPDNSIGNNLKLDSVIVCPIPDAMSPINVGANNDVGSDADFKEKAKKQVIGAAAGALASLVGLGGGGGDSGANGPPTYKDPVKKRDKTKVQSKKPKRRINVGAGFTPGGLIVSSEIDNAPGKGTFQTIFLQNPRGWRLMPISLYMYEIWGSWKLNVSWTKDTYVDGEHVAHEEGGWTESWTELIAQGEQTNYVEVQEAPLWEQLGFNTAVSGAKSLGTLFPVTREMLEHEAFDLFIHVTDPDKDPVTTIPYHFQLSLDDEGKVVTEYVEPTVEIKPDPCKERASFMSVTPDGGQLTAPGVTKIEDGYSFVPADVPNTNTKVEFVNEAGEVVASSSIAPGESSSPPENTSNSTESTENEKETMDFSDISEMDDEEIQEILKDPSMFGRKLSPEEIAALKTKPGDRDRDGDGIEDNIDTMPDTPSDSFITGSMIGRILNHNGQAIIVEGEEGAISIEVSNDGDGGSVDVELLGVGLELSPGTIMEASFG